jgi:MYXO-CTERM domain-containing protein
MVSGIEIAGGACVLSLLLLSTALTPTDTAFEVRAPIYCPFQNSRYTVIAPFDEQPIPTNASFWIVENVALPRPDLELTDLSTNSTVAFDLEVTPSATYNLVRMKPARELRAGARYRLEGANDERFGGASQTFVTGLAPDVTPPAAPVVNGTPFAFDDGCTGTVLSVNTNNGFAVTRETLLALEPGSGELLAFGARGVVNILASEDEELAYDLVLVDLAGNRSDATARKDVARFPPGVDDGGCTCVPSRTDSPVWAAPFALFLLWGTRRRGRALKSAWDRRSSRR